MARETASRAFTAAFGVPARQFRSELRARAAWLQVVRTRDSLAAIAVATGFADQAHMTRHVRALTGASPARWRRDPRAQDLRRVPQDAICRPGCTVLVRRTPEPGRLPLASRSHGSRG